MCLFVLGVFEVAAVEAGYAELAAEVEQIDGARIPSECHNRQASWFFGQHDGATHVDAVKDQPDVSGAVLQRTLLAVPM